MGRHSQTSSWSTTLVELGALASKSLPGSNSTGTRGRRRAQGAAKTSVAPMMYRAGGVAAALSIAVSGGAYAATQVNDGGGKSLNETEVRLAAIGSPNGSVNSQTSGLTIEGQSDSVYTVTEESTEEHGRVEKETDSLPEGETKVETEGVDGLVRTTYEVTSKDGTEVSRTPLSSSVVTEKVDEVVLVGTGSGAQKPAGEAYGIPQALPGSKMSSVADDWATNPSTQITWGMQYIQGRYGTPCSAWAHSESVGWY